jgi:two-component system phosphate regulon sensor histidine kinase PhoR
MKIQTKLTILLLLFSICGISGSGIFTSISLERFFRNRLITELKTEAVQISLYLQHPISRSPDPYAELERYAEAINTRITLIDSLGVVCFDSDMPKEKLPLMENHIQRLEVREALIQGTGTSTRLSKTLNVEMMYFALRLPEPLGGSHDFRNVCIVRVGLPLAQVNQLMGEVKSTILIVSLIILFAVAVMTFLVSRKMSAPLREIAVITKEIQSGALDKRIPVRTKDEFGMVAESVNAMVDKLNEDIQKLKKLEQVRSEFLGNVSHELRTPIFSIQGMLETLLNGALDDKEVSRNFVERALANTNRLNILLSDLIEISRIESGEMKMSFRYFDIGEMLVYVTEEMEEIARQKGVRLVLENEIQKKDVFGDKERVKQVLSNLINNAIKYNRPQGSVTVRCSDIEGAVRVTVEDTGVGIPAEHIPRIFERFYRVDKERSREAGGTGLGLAIVKHIVDAHGSKISVVSEAGKGTAFSFVLKT